MSPSWSLIACAVLAACSPFGGGAFDCTDSSQCTPSGVCQPNGFCSFADPTCPMGQRYGAASGPSANTCVGGGGSGSDASVDAPPDTPPGELCVGSGPTVCFMTPPTAPRTLPPMIDTDTDCDQVVMQNGGPDLCVVAATTVTVTATTAHGMRPLVVVATDTITINGALDVSSTAAMTGASANATSCTPSTAGATDTGGGAGGGGGSFSAKGGDGGGGDDNNNGPPAGPAAPGVAGAAMTAVNVRGGCPGAKGGDDMGTFVGGPGGDSGGAVYLIAANTITVGGSGGVFASGAGGQAGAACAGGGGGGTGGMIGFDAPMIAITGVVAANGGGGGGGGSTTVGGGGGGDGTTTMFNMRAMGGTGAATNGGAGGHGSALGNAMGEVGVHDDCGGGGGGGGIGVVWTHGTMTGTQISPAPTLH